MATIQVRDVPDDVAEVIAEKAGAAQQSVSAYLPELMAAAVADDLRQRAGVEGDGWAGDNAAVAAKGCQHRPDRHPGCLASGRVRDVGAWPAPNASRYSAGGSP